MTNSLITINKNNEPQKYVSFTAGKNKYALNILNIMEIMNLPELDYPQKLPSNIAGLLKFNNIILNITDVRFFLNLEIEPYTINNKLLIVKTTETIFGIIVDKVGDIIDLNGAQTEFIPFVSPDGIIKTTCIINGETISILDAEAIENALKNNTTSSQTNVCNLFPSDKNSVEVFKQRALKLFERQYVTETSDIFSENKFAVFVLNDNTYGINLKSVKEFYNRINLTPLPCSKDFIEGIVAVRGEFITVLNLKKLLNFEKTQYFEDAKIIILNSDIFKCGILADNIKNIIEVREEKIKKITLTPENKFFSTEIIDNNTVTPILDTEKLLSDEKLFIDEE